MDKKSQMGTAPAIGGWAGWVMKRLRGARSPHAHKVRLTLLDRLALAPRQTLALVEADGRRFLVATSAEGSPAFLALEGAVRPDATPNPRYMDRRQARRISW